MVNWDSYFPPNYNHPNRVFPCQIIRSTWNILWSLEFSWHCYETGNVLLGLGSSLMTQTKQRGLASSKNKKSWLCKNFVAFNLRIFYCLKQINFPLNFFSWLGVRAFRPGACSGSQGAFLCPLNSSDISSMSSGVNKWGTFKDANSASFLV